MTVPLEAKLDFLKTAENYPEGIQQVTAIETHMSWVFLAGDHVFKLKKPVQFPLLDLTTLGSREHNCREEVRLNRRLAPDVYLGVVPLVLRDGALALDGKGEVIDWLVEMRRLPADRMLSVRLAGDLVSEHDLEPLIGVLADLLTARSMPIRATGSGATNFPSLQYNGTAEPAGPDILDLH